MNLEESKEKLFAEIDAIFLKVQEIWKCSLTDMLFLNDLVGRMHILREHSTSLKTELQFVSPAGGRFWARNILENMKLEALKSEIHRLRNQVEILGKNKEAGMKKCREELVVLDELEQELRSLKKELIRAKS